jgi:phage terminase large subunit-like protein
MSPRNHADCVGNYCDAVLTGEIIAGRYVQLAVERHLDDLEHAHQRGLHFDADIAGKSLRFVEAVCTHQKAEWAGQAFLLSPNQQFILWNLIGWRRADGCRRFRRAYITAGRTFRSLLAQFGLTPKSIRGLAASDPVDGV